MWLGGTNALWQLGDGAAAAPLFYQYGAAARTPQTRSKGFFWAGEAYAARATRPKRQRYYEMAADYADRFYGLLALDRLGRDVPGFDQSTRRCSPRRQNGRRSSTTPITRAVSEVARDAPWSTGIRFYREIADQADTLGEHMLVAELARDIGRRDLAVILADAAMADGHDGFTRIGYPTLDTPPGTNWTMIHALARQESQFAENAISHAGARGLMQFMPATAQEEARRARVQYSASRLIDDPSYSMQLGYNHIERLIALLRRQLPAGHRGLQRRSRQREQWLARKRRPAHRGRLAALDRGDRLLRNEELRAARGGECGGLRTPLPRRTGRAGGPRDVTDFLR